jgi:radical SAM protein with 4Fe4S-binding SPASM domain
MGVISIVKNSYQILRCVSWPRIKNAFILWKEYKQTKKTGILKHTALPFSLSIEPTTSCNLRCPQCPSGLRAFTRPTGMLQKEVFEKIIDQVHKHVGYLTMYFQGEPFLNQSFLEMIHYASRHKIYTATSSNAHYFTSKVAEETVKSGLNKLIISIDGVTQESYKHYRIGGDLNKVLDGTKELIKAKRKLGKSTPHIVWQFIVFKHNEKEIPEIKRLAKEYKVDSLQIKTAQVYDFETTDQWIPENKKWSRYTEVNGKMVFKNSLLNHCWRMWHSAVITWDGSVVPCCFDKDASHYMGSLQEKKFKEIWYGEAYNNFRTKLLAGRGSIDICKNCSEGTKVFI